MVKNDAILAIDYGGRYVGIAIYKSDERIAKPLTTLYNDENLMQQLQNLVDLHDVSTIVVGLPRNLDGESTQQTKLTEEFARLVESTINVRIIFQDEALTSEFAEQRLAKLPIDKRKKLIHQSSAQIILEDYVKNI